jgi:hypothetical protein
VILTLASARRVMWFVRIELNLMESPSTLKCFVLKKNNGLAESLSTL